MPLAPTEVESSRKNDVVTPLVGEILFDRMGRLGATLANGARQGFARSVHFAFGFTPRDRCCRSHAEVQLIEGTTRRHASEAS